MNMFDVDYDSFCPIRVKYNPLNIVGLGVKISADKISAVKVSGTKYPGQNIREKCLQNMYTSRSLRSLISLASLGRIFL